MGTNRLKLSDYILYGLDVIGILVVVFFILLKVFPQFENALQIPFVIMLLLFFILALFKIGLSVDW